MAKKEDEGTAAATPAFDMHAFAGVLAQAIAQAQSIYSPREIKEGDPEYVALQKAAGEFDLFERPVYQNAYEAQARGLSADIRHKASNLKSGTYKMRKGRMVTVEASEKQIVLRYPTKGDAMMINQTNWNDFSDLIEQLWEAQNAPVPA